MKTFYKRCLFLGLALSAIAVIEAGIAHESELEGALDKPAPAPDPSPAMSFSGQDGHTARILPMRPAAQMPLPPLSALGPYSSAATVTFSGTVIRNGSRFALRETAGNLYPIDSVGRVWSFEGEDVRVTGKFDSATSLLHIDDIQAMAI